MVILGIMNKVIIPREININRLNLWNKEVIKSFEINYFTRLRWGIISTDVYIGSVFEETYGNGKF